MPCNNGQKGKRTRKGNSKDNNEAVKKPATRKLRSNSLDSQEEAVEIQKTCEVVEDLEAKPADNLEYDPALNKYSQYSTKLTTDNIETLPEMMMTDKSYEDASGAVSFSFPHNLNEATCSKTIRNVCTSDMTQTFEDVPSFVSQNKNVEKINSNLSSNPMENIDTTLEDVGRRDNYDPKNYLHKQPTNLLQHVCSSNFEHFKVNTSCEMIDVQINDYSKDDDAQMCAVDNLTQTKVGQNAVVDEVIYRGSDNIVPNRCISLPKSQICEMRFDKPSLQTNRKTDNLADITSTYLGRSSQINLYNSADNPEAITSSTPPPSASLKRSLHSPLSNSQVKKFKYPYQQNIADQNSSTSYSTCDSHLELRNQIEDILDIQHQDGCRSELEVHKEAAQCMIISKQLLSDMTDIPKHANYTSYDMEHDDVVFQRQVMAVKELISEEEKYAATSQMGKKEFVPQKQLVTTTAIKIYAMEKYPVRNSKENEVDVCQGHLAIEANNEKKFEEKHPTTTKHNCSEIMHADVTTPYSSLVHCKLNEEPHFTKTETLKQGLSVQQPSCNMNTDISLKEVRDELQHNQEQAHNDDHPELTVHCPILMDVKQFIIENDMTASIIGDDSLKLFSNCNTDMVSGDKQRPDLMKSYKDQSEVKDVFTSTQELNQNKIFVSINASDREVTKEVTNQNERQESSFIESTQEFTTTGFEIDDILSKEKAQILERIPSSSKITDNSPSEECSSEIRIIDINTEKSIDKLELSPASHSFQDKNKEASHKETLCLQQRLSDHDRACKSNPTNATETSTHTESCCMMKSPIRANTFQNQNEEAMPSQDFQCRMKANSDIHTEPIASTMCQNENDSSTQYPLPVGIQILDIPQSTFLHEPHKLDIPQSTLQDTQELDIPQSTLQDIQKLDIPQSTLQEIQELHIAQSTVLQHTQKLDIPQSTLLQDTQKLDIPQSTIQQDTQKLDIPQSILLQSTQKLDITQSTECTSNNSLLAIDNLDHYSVTDFLRMSSQQSGHLESDFTENVETALSNADLQKVSIAQASNYISDQQEASSKQPKQSVTDFHETSNKTLQDNPLLDQPETPRQQPQQAVRDVNETSDNTLQYNSLSDQPETYKEQPTKLATDFHITSNVVKHNTVSDSLMDLSDSQICQLAAEDFDHPLNSTFSEAIDESENLHNYNFEQNFDSALTKSAKQIEERKAEGKKLVDEIMSNLVSLNKQLLKMKREMETVRRVVQQQYSKHGFSFNSNPVSGFGKGN